MSLKYFLSLKFIRDSVSKDFIGSWSRQDPLPCIYQSSGLSKRKQVVSKTTLFIQCWYSELPLLVMEWWHFSGQLNKLHTPASQRANLADRSFWSQQSQACYVNSFLYCRNSWQFLRVKEKKKGANWETHFNFVSYFSVKEDINTYLNYSMLYTCILFTIR